VPVSRWLVADFVFLASKRPGARNRLLTWIDERLKESDGKSRDAMASTRPLTWALHTAAFKNKSIVRLGDARTASDVAYLKIFTGNQERRAYYEMESTNRTRVQESLSSSGTELVRVPQTYGTLQIGIAGYHLEAASQGNQISAMVRKLGYFDNARRVERDFSQICERIIELTSALQNVSGAQTIEPTYRDIPETLRTPPDLAAEITDRGYFQKASPEVSATWIQHGDLSVENTHLDRETGLFEVFDWCDLAGGLPPLYDFFQFFYSTGYLSPQQETVRFASEEDRWIATFKAVFLSDSSFGRLTRRLIRHACKRLNVPARRVPSLLLEFLIIRSNYYVPRSGVQHRVHLRLLELCVVEFERLQSDWERSEAMAPPSMAIS
jgi:hypothetical protein